MPLGSDSVIEPSWVHFCSSAFFGARSELGDLARRTRCGWLLLLGMRSGFENFWVWDWGSESESGKKRRVRFVGRRWGWNEGESELNMVMVCFFFFFFWLFVFGVFVLWFDCLVFLWLIEGSGEEKGKGLLYGSRIFTFLGI